MKFFIGTPDYNKVFENTVRVKAYLRTGPAEIYENHQDLLGKIKNNLLEIDTITDGKTEKHMFVVQEAVFIVSSKGKEETTSYSYGNRIQEISANTPIDELKKEIEDKKELLETESKKLLEKELEEPLSKLIQSTIISLQDDVDFVQKILAVMNERK